MTVESADANSESAARYTNPLLRWVGSKRWLVDQLVPVIRQALKPGGRLIEPFAGGAAVTIACAPEHGVLSDACEPLMRVHAAVRYTPDELVQTLAALRNGLASEKLSDEDAYYRIRESFNARTDKTPKCLVAAMLIYLNRTGFNALFRTSPKSGFNTPFGKREMPWPTEIEIRAVSAAMHGVETRCCTWQEALADARTGDVVYADSPYEDVFDTYGKKWMSEDHDALASRLTELGKAGISVLSSQPYSEKVKARYGAFRQLQIAVPGGHKVGGTGKRRGAKDEWLFAANL